MTDEEKRLAEEEAKRLADEEEAKKNSGKIYTKEDLDKLSKDKEVEAALKLAAVQAEKEKSDRQLEETNARLKAIEKQLEDEKIAKMEKEEKDKYFREKAKEEAKIREEAKAEAERQEREKFNLEKAEVLRKAILIERKELAIEAGLPSNLIRYVLGDNKEEINLSIKQLKEDFNITDESVKKTLQETVEKTLINGGVVHQSGIGELKLKLEDFYKLTSNEKLLMMANEPDKWKAYRTLQKKSRGEL